MHRFLVLPADITENTARIRDDEYKHLTRVLRLGPGDEVEVFDGAGAAYLIRLTWLTDREAEGEIIRRLERAVEPALPVILAQGLPKGDKMDLIVQKCTEIGVTRIIPLETERAVVKLTADKGRERQQRWQRIALEAAKQCRRNRVPTIDPVTPWAKAVGGVPAGAVGLLPWEEEQGQGLKNVLRQIKPSVDGIYIFVGPEGGLSAAEVETARKYGVTPVSLGPRILRTETAGLAATTMILYELGDLGGGSV